MQKLILDIPDSLRTGLESEAKLLGIPTDQLINMALWVWFEKEKTQRSFLQPIHKEKPDIDISDYGDLMDARAGAVFLGMSYGKFTRMVRNGIIPYEKHENKKMYSKTRLKEWRKRQQVEPESDEINGDYSHLTLVK